MADDLDAGTKDRAFYTTQSLQKAFGDPDVNAWDPDQGFGPNRARLFKMYTYYQALYQAKPDQFLWAGLAHMAGGTVVGGMDLVLSTSGEGAITKTMMAVAKNIFLDLAWLHEAFLDSPDTAIALAGVRDGVDPKPAAGYAQAITDIASGDATRVGNGNQALLQNEQFCLVQPGMDSLTAIDPMFFNSTNAFTYAVHPYHRDFIIVKPQGQITHFDDRWAWITEPDGMWAKWTAMPGVAPDERARLVALSFEDVVARKFGPLVQALLPTGANDEDAT